jgi:hypothetical protein
MFNQEARWDRHLPNESFNEEPIEVGVIFKAGNVYPRWFTWRGRKYPVKDVTYHWTDKRGGEVLHFYSVTDGANLYQIHFNNRYLHWRIDKVCPLQ